MQSRLKTVLFDYDDTLVMTNTYYKDEWRNALQQYDLPFSDGLWELMMLHNSDPVLVVRQLFGVDVGLQQRRTIGERVIERIRSAGVVEGCEELVDQCHAHGITVALVTNADRSWLETTSPPGFLKRFDVVTTDAQKPAPAAIRSTTRSLGARAYECVGVDDTWRGIQGLLAAGVTPLHIPVDARALPVDGIAQAESLAAVDVERLQLLVSDRSNEMSLVR